MNAKRVNAAAGVILAAQKTRQPAAGIAMALEAACLLQSPESAAELAELGVTVAPVTELAEAVALLGALPMPVGPVPVAPVVLTEQQIEALVDAGNAALGSFYHERACACWEYPAGCATNPMYAAAAGYWDTDAFAVGLPAVIALWESMRNDRHLSKVAELRARVAELEAEQSTVVAERDAQIIAWLVKKAGEEGTSNKDSRVRATAIYRMADKLSRGAVRPACPPVPVAPAMVCRECAASVRWVDGVSGGWWNHVSPARDGHGIVPKPFVDPCHPCGCPKRFDRHADGCPQAVAPGELAEQRRLKDPLDDTLTHLADGADGAS